MKKQNGITLIALIITIIVLLILAVVTIGVVQENSIIEHAQNAATKHNIAQEDEKENLSSYETLIEDQLLKGTIKYYVTEHNSNEMVWEVKYIDSTNIEMCIHIISEDGTIEKTGFVPFILKDGIEQVTITLIDGSQVNINPDYKEFNKGQIDTGTAYFKDSYLYCTAEQDEAGFKYLKVPHVPDYKLPE